MFALNPQKHETPMATPWGVFKPGREADLSKVPAKVKQKWIEDEDVIQNDRAPDLFEDMPEDGLSGKDRNQLKQFIVDHGIQVKVKVAWKDEEIRQAIRDYCDPEELAGWLAPQPAALTVTENPALSGSVPEGGSLAATPPQA